MNDPSTQVNGAAPGMFLMGYGKCMTFPAWEAESFLGAAPVSPALGSDWERRIYFATPVLSRTPSRQVDGRDSFPGAT